MPRRIKVDFGEVFPHGTFAVSEVTAMRDFDRSTRDAPVQAVDEDSNLPIWTVDVLDADPEARKNDRQFSVRIAASVQPVLPDALPGVPFRPVVFTGLTATPYVSENGMGRSRLAWSFRAAGVEAPSRAGSASDTGSGSGGASGKQAAA